MQTEQGAWDGALKELKKGGEELVKKLEIKASREKNQDGPLSQKPRKEELSSPTEAVPV